MGRFSPGGRGGRFGQSGPQCTPKYLSLSPPKPKFRAPDLKSNPFFDLRHQFSDKHDPHTVEIIDETNDDPTKNNDMNDNGWKTIFNPKTQMCKKSPNNSQLTVTTTNLSPLRSKYKQTTSPIWNNSLSSSNNFSELAITTSPKIVSPSAMSTMSDSTAHHKNSPDTLPTITQSQDDPMTGTPKKRRSKKSRGTPPNTPTKLRKRNQHASVSPPRDQNPQILSSSSTDDEIDNMSHDYLATVLYKTAKTTGHAVDDNTFSSLAISVLKVRAKAHRDSLRRKPIKTKNVIVPIIKFDTLDKVINDLDKDLSRATYISCMRKINTKIDRNKLNSMSIEDFKKGIFEYRSKITATEFDFSPDEFDFPEGKHPPNDDNTPDDAASQQTIHTSTSTTQAPTTTTTDSTTDADTVMEDTTTTSSSHSAASNKTTTKPPATPLRDVPIGNTSIKTPPPPSQKPVHTDIYTTEKNS